MTEAELELGGSPTCLAVALAVPISHVIGKAHLDLYRAKLEVDELSRIDPLTGLPNRRAFFEAAAACPERRGHAPHRPARRAGFCLKTPAGDRRP
jgi:hypothetical protein